MKSLNGLYEAEVRVRGKSLREVEHKGVTYIEGRRKSTYELWFRNNSYSRILVVPSVDGLSVMDGKPAGVDSSGYVVEPRGEITIPGWRLNNTSAASFEFLPRGDKQNPTYVEALKSEGVNLDEKNQGLIGFMVFREEIRIPVIRPNWTYIDHSVRDRWYTSGQTPHDVNWGQSVLRGVSSGANSTLGAASVNSVTMAQTKSAVTHSVDDAVLSSSSSMGTGFGKETEFRTTTTEFERDKSSVVTMVIEYDTRQALAARGVPTQLFDPKRYREKDRSAFPASPEIGCRRPQKWLRG